MMHKYIKVIFLYLQSIRLYLFLWPWPKPFNISGWDSFLNGVETFTTHLCPPFKQRPQAAMEAMAATFDRYQRTELPAILHRHPRFEVATAVAIYGLLPGAQGSKRSQISIGNKPLGSSTFVPAESAK